MKNHFIIIVLLFNLVSYAQSYQIEYQAKVEGYDLDTKKGRELSSSVRTYLLNTNQKMQQISEVLVIKVVSESDKYHLSYPNIMMKDGLSDFDLTSTQSWISIFPEIYYEDNTSYGISKSYSDWVVKSKSQQYFKWDLTSETKSILGFKCYRAVPIMKDGLKKPDNAYIPEEVWFAPELNFRAAPALFADVPGAILEYNTNSAKIKAISVNQVDKKVKRPNFRKYEIIDYKTFNKRVREESQKFIGN